MISRPTPKGELAEDRDTYGRRVQPTFSIVKDEHPRLDRLPKSSGGRSPFSSFGECFGSRRNHPLWRAVTNGRGPVGPRTPPKRPSLWHPVASLVAEPQGLLPSLAKTGSTDAPREEQSFPDQGHLPLTETLAGFHRSVARHVPVLSAVRLESSPSPEARSASPDPLKRGPASSGPGAVCQPLQCDTTREHSREPPVLHLTYGTSPMRKEQRDPEGPTPAGAARDEESHLAT